ncbi:hypothetical protein ACHAWF_012360 [Thalassiosira exigua]
MSAADDDRKSPLPRPAAWGATPMRHQEPPASSPLSAPAPSSPSFDLGAKLAQRLQDHKAERDAAQKKIDHEAAQLQHLFKTAPKRPRETKAALQQKAKKLERDRTSRSLPLSQEKALIRQIETTQKLIRQHAQAEKHQQLVARKKAQIEASREAFRSLNATISEIETTVSKVELGKDLGCLPSEVVSREIDCPPNKLSWALGKDDVRDIEEGAGVKIDVDKIRGKIVVRGSQSAADEAISRLESFTRRVDEEMRASADLIAHLLARDESVLGEIKAGNPDVMIDVSSKSKVIKLRGLPDSVQKARSDIGGVQVLSQTRTLVGRETSLVAGKIGSAIDTFSEQHLVVVDLSKDGPEKSKLRVVGPSKNVDAAMAEVDKLLFEHEEITESIVVDPLMKTELLNKSGVGIKEFQRSLGGVLAAHNPDAGEVSLAFDRNSPREAPPVLLLKCSRCVMERAKRLVMKKIDEFSSNVISIEVSKEMISNIIGKGGATINELRKEGKGALVETDEGKGVVNVYSNDAETRDAIRNSVVRIIAENQVGCIPIEKSSIGFLLGDPGKDVRKACSELGCSLTMSDDDTKLVIKGTNEKIDQASKLLKDYLAKNHIEELDVSSDDEPLLFAGGSDSILHKVEANHDVKATFRKGKSKLQVRGEANNVGAALKDAKQFLNGGDGMAVCKFGVPEEAIPVVIGKGGSNIHALEKEFKGVLVFLPKSNNTISIRGPEDMVKRCRTRVITTIATTRVSESIGISQQQHEELSKSDIIKRVSRFTNAQIVLSETSVKIRGVTDDVRDAKANILEHLTGTYYGYIDLLDGQFRRVDATIKKDPSHLQRIHSSTGAEVTMEDSGCAIQLIGKRSCVKKAKSLVMELLDFVLPRQLRSLKVHRSLFRSIGEPKRLALISTETGASISLDRDMSSILVRSDDPSSGDKALELVEKLLIECQKLNAVISFDTTDAWLLPLIIGHGGSNIKRLEAESGCSIDTLKDELTVVVSADKQESVVKGKDAVEKVVSQAKKENLFIDLPESCMAAFIGKGGAGIRKLAADNGVRVERSKKHPSQIKVSGNEHCVASAHMAVSSWLEEWKSRNEGIELNLEEKLVPTIIGKRGATVRSIEKQTGCKIDVDRQKNSLTVRHGSDENRKEAVTKIQGIIDEEKARSAERATAKAKKLKQEKDESAIESEEEIVSTALDHRKQNEKAQDPKDQSAEFAQTLVGLAPVVNEENGSIPGKDEGQQLYQFVLTGQVGDAVKHICKDYMASPHDKGEDRCRHLYLKYMSKQSF